MLKVKKLKQLKIFEIRNFNDRKSNLQEIANLGNYPGDFRL